MTPIAQPISIFDQAHYVKHIEARGQVIKRLVPELKHTIPLITALDAGCGLGFFASLLRESGLKAHGFDGRENNVADAGKRYPDISFTQGDIEEKSIRQLGVYDLVLCFGLLYHLENPMRAIRNLRALTGKILLLETMCLPTSEPIALLRTEPNSDDQSLTDLAFYPSEGCIIKMLHHAGFTAIYRVANLPDHEDFRETATYSRRRTIIVAGFKPLSLIGLIPLQKPPEPQYPWEKPPSRGFRMDKFLASRAKRKGSVLAKRLWRRITEITLPIRLPFGAWWIGRKDHVSQPIMKGTFEKAELAFVEKFLQPGMTVLDIGAHHGLYTLLASKRVGSKGRVIAFEPSPRESKALRLHLRLNLCSNVTVQACAVGSEDEEALLYIVEKWAAGCNSLKPPDIPAEVSTTSVHVVRLDDWLEKSKIERVDFIKLDVEGAELAVLHGAQKLFEHLPRPVLLVEVQDLRTEPWGYAAREIIDFLERRKYLWFQLSENGTLGEIDTSVNKFDLNLVAIPDEVKHLVLSQVSGKALKGPI